MDTKNSEIDVIELDVLHDNDTSKLVIYYARLYKTKV